MAEYKCAGGCGRVIIDPATNPSEPGWSYLPITGRWRCGQCERELREVGKLDHSKPPTSAERQPPDTCPLPLYDCACRGDWCRLLGRNLRG